MTECPSCAQLRAQLATATAREAEHAVEKELLHVAVECALERAAQLDAKLTVAQAIMADHQRGLDTWDLELTTARNQLATASFREEATRKALNLVTERGDAALADGDIVALIAFLRSDLPDGLRKIRVALDASADPQRITTKEEKDDLTRSGEPGEGPAPQHATTNGEA